MATGINPTFAAIMGSLLWTFLVVVGSYLSMKSKAHEIDQKIIMMIWDLVKVLGGALFSYLFGGSV